jgi:hypothetical protein
MVIIKFTYIVLVPHNVEERIKGQIIVGTGEAGKGSENGTSKEHAVEVLLG